MEGQASRNARRAPRRHGPIWARLPGRESPRRVSSVEQAEKNPHEHRRRIVIHTATPTRAAARRGRCTPPTGRARRAAPPRSSQRPPAARARRSRAARSSASRSSAIMTPSRQSRARCWPDPKSSRQPSARSAPGRAPPSARRRAPRNGRRGLRHRARQAVHAQSRRGLTSCKVVPQPAGDSAESINGRIMLAERR